MATYLWKEVSTHINLHVSQSTKWWKNRSVFNFSNTTNMLRVRRGYLKIQTPHKEAHESATKKAHVPLLLAETQTDDEEGRCLILSPAAAFGPGLGKLWDNTDTTAKLQDVVEELTMKPHGGENHLVCYSVLFTVHFHSAITVAVCLLEASLFLRVQPLTRSFKKKKKGLKKHQNYKKTKNIRKRNWLTVLCSSSAPIAKRSPRVSSVQRLEGHLCTWRTVCGDFSCSSLPF